MKLPVSREGKGREGSEEDMRRGGTKGGKYRRYRRRGEKERGGEIYIVKGLGRV